MRRDSMRYRESRRGTLDREHYGIWTDALAVLRVEEQSQDSAHSQDRGINAQVWAALRTTGVTIISGTCALIPCQARVTPGWAGEKNWWFYSLTNSCLYTKIKRISSSSRWLSSSPIRFGLGVNKFDSKAPVKFIFAPGEGGLISAGRLLYNLLNLLKIRPIANRNQRCEHIHRTCYKTAGVIKHIIYHFGSSPPILQST